MNIRCSRAPPRSLQDEGWWVIIFMKSQIHEGNTEFWMCTVLKSFLKCTGVWYTHEVETCEVFKDVILVIKFEEAQWCWISIRVACIWKLKNCLFQEWLNRCLGNRCWECVYRDFGSAWKLRIHIEGLHKEINRCLLPTDFDGWMIQKISWDDKWNVNKMY